MGGVGGWVAGLTEKRLSQPAGALADFGNITINNGHYVGSAAGQRTQSAQTNLKLNIYFVADNFTRECLLTGEKLHEKYFNIVLGIMHEYY